MATAEQEQQKNLAQHGETQSKFRHFKPVAQSDGFPRASHTFFLGLA